MTRALVVCLGLTVSLAALAENDAASTTRFKNVQQAHAAVDWPGLPEDVRDQLQRTKPRDGFDTRWLRPDGQPWFTNRLALSRSPYLLEHAHNPIDWYPWGPEALAAAKAQHKPLFISIGYASCHWCHVMARQSFENLKVARLLNRDFIAIKIDRQQHPALDRRFQTVVAIATNGQTGWPATVLALPDGRPFYANVFQPRAKLVATLERASHLWQNKRQGLIHDADALSGLVDRVLDRKARAQTIKPALFARAARQLNMAIDPFNGGFGHGNKFPQATRLRFLLDRISRGDSALKAPVIRTLDSMMRGGIHDQIGGGFFRYTTTPDWRVPHFEKMLYDQAQLAMVYLRAGMVLDRRDYLNVARDTLDFVLRQMRAPDGGFVAALSADSPAHRDGARQEGAYYTWTPAQLRHALRSADDRKLAAAYWQIDAHGDFDGASVPHRATSDTTFARQHGMTVTELRRRIAPIRHQLAQARRMRPLPARDDNRITAWNGLMIRTLADAGRTLDEPRYTRAASRAGKFVWRYLRDDQGVMHRAWRKGQANGTGTLADQADAALGYLALYDATGKPRWREHARELAQVIERHFAAPDGGFLDQRQGQAHGDSTLAPQLRPYEDDAEPAGNPQVLRLFTGLAARIPSTHFEDAADRLIAAFSGLVNQQPLAATGLLDAIANARSPAPAVQAWGAHGGLQIHSRRVGPGRAQLVLDLQRHWHVNAHRTHPDLIPTQVTAVAPLAIAKIDYPNGTQRHLSFSDKPLRLYTGRQKIQIRLSRPVSPKQAPLRLKLRFQACNQTVCLAPAERTLLIAPARASIGPRHP